MIKESKKIRIAIIGAGPGGLAAAEALKELGYHNVVVFEKRNRVGGQAFSPSYVTKDGRKIIYEMGSLQPLGAWMGDFHRLIKRYHVHFTKGIPAKIGSFKENKTYVDFTKYPLGYPIKDMLPLMSDAIKLSYYLFRYRKLAKQEYTHISDEVLAEVSVPYTQWIAERNFKIIGKDLDIMAGTMVTFANPELKDQAPAIKFIRLLLQFLKLPMRYINGQIKCVVEGYQNLWVRVAEHHHVILNAHIKKITRSTEGVSVELEDGIQKFDKIIIACPPYETLKFLDVTAQEKSIFEKIKYNPGWRAAFTAKNLPHDAGYLFYDPYQSKDSEFRLISFLPHGQIDDETWLYGAIFAYNKHEGIEKITEQTKQLLEERYHAHDIQWINLAFWHEYTPFFSCEEVRNGIYQKLENLQGKNNTIYVGAFISGGTHGIVSNYAYKKMRQFF